MRISDWSSDVCSSDLAPDRRNAVSFAMWQAIPKILKAFAEDDEVRVVVMRGEGGKAFVSGADISEFAEKRSTPEQVATYNDATHAAHLAMDGLEKPFIAMIQGFFTGGGLATALRSEERSVGTACGSTCRTRGPP